ncbi:hypothetical protein [Terracoccus luteus]|uniref:Uncharacterized protein n=1 Tax=Terracoccus luteus TaxID=53356 RepID=A0A839Q655_9MICO|nr:hypothetical protein [Terracoccus luteus]MBB2988121.1 hypothetical protein [Terracoccus luteus]MCP2174139.1 hypothetical protein [Terracoccus luteus]
MTVAEPDLSNSTTLVRLVKVRITQSRGIDGILIPALELRLRNVSDSPLDLSLDATFTGEVEAWFGGLGDSEASVAPGAVRSFSLAYNNLSGYAVPQFPKAYLLENLTVTATAPT